MISSEHRWRTAQSQGMIPVVFLWLAVSFLKVFLQFVLAEFFEKYMTRTIPNLFHQHLSRNLSFPIRYCGRNRMLRSRMVMACWITASSHYLNQCWLITRGVVWCSPESNFTANVQAIILNNGFENHTYNITATSPRGQWINVTEQVLLGWHPVT